MFSGVTLKMFEHNLKAKNWNDTLMLRLTYRTVWCKLASLQNVKVNRPLAHASQII